MLTLVASELGPRMPQLVLINPLVMGFTVPSPSDPELQLLPTSAFAAVANDILDFILQLAIYFHWCRGLSRRATLDVRPEAAHMEHWVEPCKLALKVKLVGCRTHTLGDPEGTNPTWQKLACSHQMQVLRTQ